MDIPKDRFGAEVTKIIQEIADSHFVAFDLELSGVAGRSARLATGKPSLQEYYEELKEAAEKYQILQFGLTIVQEDVGKGQYVVKPYNFDISQVPTLHERQFKRTWSMNSGAISFLLKNGFDFGKQMSQGIHFLSRLEEQQVRTYMGEIDNIKRPDMVLKAEDDALIDHIRRAVKHWMGTPTEQREGFLNIPAEERAKRVPGTLNRYQMRLTHQIVQNEFPGLRTQSMNHFIQITNPSIESLNEARRLEEQSVNREICRAVGFRWLLEALAGNSIEDLPPEYVLHAVPPTKGGVSQEERAAEFLKGLEQKLQNRRKVLIGHNCFTDLVNLHKFMLGSLPEKVEDFATSMNSVFPAIVDTKHIASYGNARWGDTSLAKVDEDLKVEETPKIVLAERFDRYRYTNVEHEAGYDSLLTANVAIRASTKMQREGAYLEEVTSPNKAENELPGFGLRKGQDSTKRETRNQQTNTARVLTTKSSHSVDSVMAKKASELNFTASAELVAVKETNLPAKSPRTTNELAKVRSSFARATIYDVLDDLHNMGPNGGKEQGEELVSVASNTADEVTMVQAGEIMPRWESDFWSIFGNRLQVNGCKEGICRL